MHNRLWFLNPFILYGLYKIFFLHIVVKFFAYKIFPFFAVIKMVYYKNIIYFFLIRSSMYTINKWIYKAFQRHILRKENQIQTIKDDELRIRNERYIKGGFVERDLEYYDLSYDNRIDTTCKLGTMQMMFLRKTINLLKDKGINYLLVETPVPSVLYNSYDDHDKYTEKISEYGTFYDYNIRLKLNDSLDFYDSHHLNQNGVVKYDSLLIKDLYELKYIGDYVH